MARKCLITPVLKLNTVSSPWGNFHGLSPTNKAPSPPNWNMRSSHARATATCKQSRPKQGEGKNQASDT